MPTLARIVVFPIKSLPGVSVECAKVLSTGALEHDRRFAVVDASGMILNAKRTAGIHRISASFNLDDMSVRLGIHGESSTTAPLSLVDERSRVEAWLSEFFHQPVSLAEHSQGGFPDDPDAGGPTIVSQESLREVSEWFENLDSEEVRRRFRSNLEVKGAEAFWEDRLYAHPGAGRRFRIGQVEFAGVQPCQRCAVPPRDSRTGEESAGFAVAFARRREASLPVWAELGRFDHFYRFATNTVLSGSAGGFIEVGQPVEIV